MLAGRFEELVNKLTDDAQYLLLDSSPYEPGWMAAVTVAKSDPEDYSLFVASSFTEYSGMLIRRASLPGVRVSIPGVTGDTRATVECREGGLYDVCVYIGSLTIETIGDGPPVRTQGNSLAMPMHNVSGYANAVILR